MKPKLRIFFISSVFFITACLCCPSSSSIVQSNIQNPTATLQKVYPTPTTPILNEANFPEGKLPGITPDYIKTIMESKDFNCELIYAAIPTDPYYKWECRKETPLELLLVDYWSTSLTTVDLIRASINQFGEANESLSSSFLGFIATFPYDGSNPNQARDWVESTLPTISIAGDVREIKIGGVNFQLYGIQTARSIKIGDDLPFP